MPTQKESQAAGLPPMINLGLSAEDAPNNQKCETNPIHTRPTTKKNETNPISAPWHPDYAKQTQFAPPLPSDDPKNRNEPNFHLGEPVEDEKIETNPIPIPPPYRWRLAGFPCSRLSKTNPITTQYTESDSTTQYTIYNIQYTIPCPNHHPFQPTPLLGVGGFLA